MSLPPQPFTTKWGVFGGFVAFLGIAAEKTVETTQHFVEDVQKTVEKAVSDVERTLDRGTSGPDWLKQKAEKAHDHFVDPYEAKLAAQREEEKRSHRISEAPRFIKKGDRVESRDHVESRFTEPSESFSFSYEVLMKPAIELPDGVDPSKRETYLSEKEFQSVFGMERSAFEAFKPWKQAQLKRSKKLF